MSWQRIERHNNLMEPDEVSYAVSRREGLGQTQVIIRVARPMLDRLGWKIKDHVRILWGAEQHYGHVRLERGDNRDGTLRPRSGKSAGALAVGTTAFPDWVSPAARKATLIKARMVDGGIEFALPKDAYRTFAKDRAA